MAVTHFHLASLVYFHSNADLNGQQNPRMVTDGMKLVSNFYLELAGISDAEAA